MNPLAFLNRQGWIQAIAGLVLPLIAVLSPDDHINLPGGASLQLPKQWGVWFIVASLALVVVDAQLATGSRLRAANETAEERNRAAAAREQAARRARIQDGCLVAQCRFLLADTSRNRLQLSEALAVLLDELRPPTALGPRMAACALHPLKPPPLLSQAQLRHSAPPILMNGLG